MFCCCFLWKLPLKGTLYWKLHLSAVVLFSNAGKMLLWYWLTLALWLVRVVCLHKSCAEHTHAMISNCPQNTFPAPHMHPGRSPSTQPRECIQASNRSHTCPCLPLRKASRVSVACGFHWLFDIIVPSPGALQWLLPLEKAIFLKTASSHSRLKI